MQHSEVVTNIDFGAKQCCVQSSSLPLISHVNLGESLNFAVYQFPHLLIGDNSRIFILGSS